MIWLGNFSHSSGPFIPSPQPLYPLLPPSCSSLLEPPPMGLALLSPVLTGSLTNPTFLSVAWKQSVKLDVDCHQEGREVTYFPWEWGEGQVRGVWAKK